MIKRNMLLASAMFCSVAAFADTEMSLYEGVDVSVRVANANSKMTFSGNKVSLGGESFAAVDSIVFNHYVSVVFDGDQATVSNPFDNVDVKVVGSTVEINSIYDSRKIKYKFSGTSANGNIIFSSAYKSEFIFDNLNLTSNGVNPPIYVTTKKNTEVRLIGENSLKNSANDTVGATMRGRGQFEFKGEGSLAVTSVVGHGIQSSDYVEVKDGKITIDAFSDGIHVNDYYLQSGGEVDIKTKADGVDVGEGYAQIDGGSFKVASDADEARGIRCTKTEKENSGNININGGKVDIQLAGEGSRGLKSDAYITVDGGDVLVVMSGASIFPNKDNSTYTCGIKVDSIFTVESGKVVVICNSGAASSRCVQSDKRVVLNGGETTLYQNSDQKAHSDAKKPTCLKSDGNLMVGKVGNLYMYAAGDSPKLYNLNYIYVGDYKLDDEDDDIRDYIFVTPINWDSYKTYVK